MPAMIEAQVAALYPPASAREVLRSLRGSEGPGAVVFFTGLSGSGKSTIARALADELADAGPRRVTLLDGDEVRQHLSRGPRVRRRRRARSTSIGSPGSRRSSPSTAASPSPRRSRRSRRVVATRGRSPSGTGAFLLVWVSTPLDVCEARDRKGLYARARAGEVADFTGISSPYEPPDDADVVIDTTDVDVPEAVRRIRAALEAKLGGEPPAGPSALGGRPRAEPPRTSRAAAGRDRRRPRAARAMSSIGSPGSGSRTSSTGSATWCRPGPCRPARRAGRHQHAHRHGGRDRRAAPGRADWRVALGAARGARSASSSMSPTTRTPDGRRSRRPWRARCRPWSSAHDGISTRGSSGERLAGLHLRAAPNRMTRLWRARSSRSALNATLNARTASTSGSVSDRLARSRCATSVPVAQARQPFEGPQDELVVPVVHDDAVTRSGPTTSAQRAISSSCRWRSRTTAVPPAPCRTSRRASRRTTAAALLWMFCCHFDGMIRAERSQRHGDVDPARAEVLDDPADDVRLGSGEELAAEHHAVALEPRTSSTSLRQCRRSGGVSTE